MQQRFRYAQNRSGSHAKKRTPGSGIEAEKRTPVSAIDEGSGLPVHEKRTPGARKAELQSPPYLRKVLREEPRKNQTRALSARESEVAPDDLERGIRAGAGRQYPRGRKTRTRPDAPIAPSSKAAVVTHAEGVTARRILIYAAAVVGVQPALYQDVCQIGSSDGCYKNEIAPAPAPVSTATNNPREVAAALKRKPSLRSEGGHERNHFVPPRGGDSGALTIVTDVLAPYQSVFAVAGRCAYLRTALPANNRRRCHGENVSGRSCCLASRRFISRRAPWPTWCPTIRDSASRRRTRWRCSASCSPYCGGTKRAPTWPAC